MFKRLLSLGIASAAVFCGTLWGAKPLSDGENCIPTKVDQEAQTMTVCAPTAYDPVDNEGARLYQVKWDKSTKFYMIRGVKPKSLAPWSDAAVIVSAKDRKKALEGKPFAAMAVIFGADAAKQLEGFDPLVGRVNLLSIAASQEAAFRFNGKEIKMRHRDFIGTLQPSRAKQLQPIFGRVRMHLDPGPAADGSYTARTVLLKNSSNPYAKDDPNLPTVLVIGDSISQNYGPYAAAELKGKVNFHKIPGSSGDSVRGLAQIPFWLAEAKYANSGKVVVSINHGLHDLRRACDPKTMAFLKTHQVELEDYVRNVDTILSTIEACGYQVVWVTTTPVPNDGPGRFYGRVKDEDLVYNDALKPVLAKHPKVLICDLNTLVRNDPAFDEWRKGRDVHYPEDCRKILGKAVAASILEAVAK